MITHAISSDTLHTAYRTMRIVWNVLILPLGMLTVASSVVLFCSARKAPTRRSRAVRSGTMPATSVRRRMSLLSRSCGLFDQIWPCWRIRLRLRRPGVRPGRSTAGVRGAGEPSVSTGDADRGRGERMLQAGLVYGAVAASAQAEGPYCLGGGAFDIGAHRVLFFPLSCLPG